MAGLQLLYWLYIARYWRVNRWQLAYLNSPFVNRSALVKTSPPGGFKLTRIAQGKHLLHLQRVCHNADNYYAQSPLTITNEACYKGAYCCRVIDIIIEVDRFPGAIKLVISQLTRPRSYGRYLKITVRLAAAHRSIDKQQLLKAAQLSAWRCQCAD